MQNHRKNRESHKAHRYQGAHVYITGGSSGIGLAVAHQFVQQGAYVYLFARNANKLSQAKEWLIEQNRQKVTPAEDLVGDAETLASRIFTYPLDVTDNQQVTTTLHQAIETSGAPDIVITCAGASYPNYFEQISYQQFKQTLAVNLEGTWNVLSAVVPAMKAAQSAGLNEEQVAGSRSAQGAGLHEEQVASSHTNRKQRHIVTCASIAGFIGTFGYTDYGASKFGVMGLSEALRGELKAHGISVSVLCPPDTDTPGFAIEEATKPPETVAIAGKVKLVSPEHVAKVLLRGIKRKKRVIIPGFMGKLSFFLKSHCSWLLFAIMNRAVMSAQKPHRTRKNPAQKRNNHE